MICCRSGVHARPELQARLFPAHRGTSEAGKSSHFLEFPEDEDVEAIAAEVGYTNGATLRSLEASVVSLPLPLPSMCTLKRAHGRRYAAVEVGVREFREQSARYLESDAPVAVTRRGETLGVYVRRRERV
jgi:hypothetical protein